VEQSRAPESYRSGSGLGEIAGDAIGGRLRKNFRSPFDRLRANGSIVESFIEFPFMLSLSKHRNRFFIADGPCRSVQD
jgi:hypothetical protein